MSQVTQITRSFDKHHITRNWYIVDGENKVVGRLASELAKIIRGKNKPTFTPHSDTGDKVIVINADKVKLTGKKMSDKYYLRHSGYPGGQRKTTAAELMAKKPTEVLLKAVKGMLPHNKLQKPCLKNLFLYEGAEHPHTAQQPQKLEL
ncbi:MAG: 50S ribosomal protein L13 [Bacteroidia bacterium]